MKLIVIDPRHVGLANKADVWLRVRPGTDGALALGLANIMIERRWYDEEFVRAWSNGPFLVRSDTDRLLKAEHLASAAGSGQFVAWDSQSNGGPRAAMRHRPRILPCAANSRSQL
jgi:anaerobic selenocysteine-containing dehydrogenase